MEERRNPWISDLRCVRTARQSRSERTLGALLDAAEAVYHHFRDKRALVYALLDQLALQFRATTRDAVDSKRWKGARIDEILRGYLELSLELGEAARA